MHGGALTSCLFQTFFTRRVHLTDFLHGFDCFWWNLTVFSVTVLYCVWKMTHVAYLLGETKVRGGGNVTWIKHKNVVPCHYAVSGLKALLMPMQPSVLDFNTPIIAPSNDLSVTNLAKIISSTALACFAITVHKCQSWLVKYDEWLPSSFLQESTVAATAASRLVEDSRHVMERMWNPSNSTAGTTLMMNKTKIIWHALSIFYSCSG